MINFPFMIELLSEYTIESIQANEVCKMMLIATR